MSRTVAQALAAVAISLFVISAMTGAFTTTERATIAAMKARISALEADFATSQANDQSMAADIDTLAANQTALDERLAAVEGGLTALVSDSGALRQLNDELLAMDARLDEAIPPIALTGIKPIIVCTATTCTVDVEWFSDPPATGQVEWGLTTAYGNRTTLETSLLPYHKQRIGTFPSDGKVYHFRVLASDVVSPSTGFVARASGS